jgi:hypothetical protein
MKGTCLNENKPLDNICDASLDTIENQIRYLFKNKLGKKSLDFDPLKVHTLGQ